MKKKLFTNFSKMLLMAVLVVFVGFKGWGQVNISIGSPVSQNFNSMSPSTTLPSGWKIDKNTTVRTIGTYSSASTTTDALGAVNLSSSATAQTYTFQNSGGTDFAIGGLSSGSNAKSVNAYVQLYNNGGSTINNLTISYNVKKFRHGSNAAGFSIQMYYSTNGNSWTSAGSDFLTSFTADADNNGTATPPWETSAISSKTLNQSIASSGTLYLAWEYSVTSGTTTSNAQALGIDDVSITANGDAGNSITTGTVSTPPFCVDASNSASGTVAYTSSGTYSSATFTAYLSDASGSFASPTSIGSTTADGTDPSGTINITIPSGTSSGTGYKIRIDCASPVITGSASSAFTIINGVSNISSPTASNGNTQSLLTWSNPTGCYDEIMIVAKAGSAVSGTPSGDGSSYTANSLSFIDGANTAFDGGVVVYKGTTSPETVTNLTNGTTYYFTFFTRKGSSWSTGISANATPAAVSTSTDYFRSKATGNWNSTSTWESSSDNTNWIDATLTPDYNANTITIRNGHTVTITATVSYDQVVVDAGGQVTVASTITHTLANGTGTDLTVNGTWLNSGGTWTVTGATWTVGAGGTYIHNTTASAATPLGVATLDAASNVIYRGSSSLTPAVSWSGRTYGNLTFESTSGSYSVNSISGSSAMSINGDFILGAGVTLQFTFTGDMTFAGNYIQNGTITNSTGTQVYKFSGSGKTISGSSAIEFETWNINSGASITLGSNVSIASTFTGTISGTLDCGTYTVNNGGTFTLASGATLQTANTAGINGSITGTAPSLSTSANYIFNAGAGQVTGTYLPTTINNLTVTGASTALTMSNAALTCNALTIDNGATFTIGSNKTVSANSTTTLGGTECLVIKTEGSFIDNGITGSGTARVEKDLAYDRWWYIGSPLSSSITASAAFGDLSETSGSGKRLYYYTEGNNGIYTSTVVADADALNTPLRGYTFKDYVNELTTVKFTGTLNSLTTGTIGADDNLTRSGTSFQGFNLICNPYPSAICLGKYGNPGGVGDLHTGLTLDNLDPTVWFRYMGNFETINWTSGVGTSNCSDYAAPMQAFWVRVPSGTNGTFKIDNTARVHNSQAFLKTETENNIFRMELSNGTLSDEAVVYFRADAQNSNDIFDSEKMFSDENDYPQVYTLNTDNLTLAINGESELSMNEDRIVPLGYLTNLAGTFELKATNLDVLDPGINVYLEDQLLGNIQDMRSNNTYTFTSGVIDDASRFILHFGSITTGITSASDQANIIYSYGKNIYVSMKDANGSIELYDMIGNLIISKPSEKGLNVVKTNLSDGIYIVKLSHGNNSVNEKIWIY